MPSLLDLNALLAPIPGPNPAGVEDRSLTSRLEELRHKYPRGEVDQNNQPIKPEWAQIVKLAQEALKTKAKDVGIASRLVEALFHHSGFAGLPEGLALLRRLYSECWDRLLPAIDPEAYPEEKFEPRANPIVRLSQATAGPCFPSALRLRPLFKGKNGVYSYQDWLTANSNKPEGVDKADLDAAIAAMPLQVCQQLFDLLSQALQEVNGLNQVLREKMEAQSPSLVDLIAAVEDCHRLLGGVLEQKKQVEKPPEVASVVEGTVVPGAAPAGAVQASGGAAATREQAYRMLAQAAAVLQKLEPHSPIPYMVQRAVELGKLPLPKLMKALLRETNTLSELFRELGVQDEEPPSS